MARHAQPPADPRDERVERYMNGRCAAWALAHQQTYPHLRFGVEWARLEPKDLGYNWEWAIEDGLAEHDADPDAADQWIAVHAFTHDDTYAYDASGAHPLPYRAFDGDRVDLDQTRSDLIASDLSLHGPPDPNWVCAAAPLPSAPA